MSIVEALAKVPPEKWQVQSLQSCFLSGEVKKKSASITFQTTEELVFQMNGNNILGA